MFYMAPSFCLGRAKVLSSVGSSGRIAGLNERAKRCDDACIQGTGVIRARLTYGNGEKLESANAVDKASNHSRTVVHNPEAVSFRLTMLDDALIVL